jgi:diaminopimelate epimerase
MDTAVVPMGWDRLEHPMALYVGNPHLVFFVDDVDAVPIEELGPRIETDGAFPQRINVNVGEIERDGIRLKTWERGAGLTRACGTGACATAVAAIKTKRASSPVTVSMSGGSLTIAWEAGQPIRMRGSATHVFSGEVDLDALQ